MGMKVVKLFGNCTLLQSFLSVRRDNVVLNHNITLKQNYNINMSHSVQYANGHWSV